MSEREAELERSIAHLCEVDKEQKSQISDPGSDFRSQNVENEGQLQKLLNEMESLKTSKQGILQTFDARMSEIERTQQLQSAQLDVHHKKIEDLKLSVQSMGKFVYELVH